MTGPTTKGLPILCSTSDVAAALDWTPETIRQHLVPHSEWLDLEPEDRQGKVPYVKLGGRYKIPRWWVEDVAKVMKHPRAREDA